MKEVAILIEDDVRLYQARVVRKGLEACQLGLRLNRDYTPTNCLRTAGRFTGKTYGRGKKALAEAVRDITQVIDLAETKLHPRRENKNASV